VLNVGVVGSFLVYLCCGTPVPAYLDGLESGSVPIVKGSYTSLINLLDVRPGGEDGDLNLAVCGVFLVLDLGA
jgi:hypothetical protein